MTNSRTLRKIVLLVAAFYTGCSQKSTPTTISANNSTPTDFFQSLPQERSTLPDWYLGDPQMTLIGVPGAVFNWTMKARTKGNKNLIDSAVFALFLRKDNPISISVESTSGYPVIMVTDRFIHKNDFYALFSENSGGNIDFPGRTLAYEIGNSSSATLCINPQRNGLVNIWIWILEGQMKYQPYTNPFTDIAGDSILALNKEMILFSQFTDSIEHFNYIGKAWKHNGLTSVKTIKSASVKVTIGSLQQNCRELKDVFFEFVDSDNARNALKESIGSWVQWKTVEDSMINLKSAAIANAIYWHHKGLSLDDSLFPISPEFKLKSFCSLALLQSELAKRRKLQESFTDSLKMDDHLKMKLLLEGGDQAILTNKLSASLSKLLPQTGGLSIAVYDNSGYIVGATSPFMFVTISNQSEWKTLLKNNSDLIKSECYNIRGYPFQLKKVFIPVKDLADNHILGWLMAEIYCK